VSLLDSLRDRLAANSRPLTAVAAPVAWLGLSALFGTLQILDWVVAAVLLGAFGYSARRKKPADDNPERGIYGPPD
jgi:hypothetical protein